MKDRLGQAVTPTDVECPLCKARPGQWCIALDGVEVEELLHVQRVIVVVRCGR